MPPFLRFLIYRLLSIPITLLIITAFLYGFIMLTPPAVRASLYISSGVNLDKLTGVQINHLIDMLILKYHLNDSYLVQYSQWISNLVRGDWGWSRVLNEEVLSALARRAPVTAELTIYSLLLFIPLGLICGVIAGWKKDQRADNRFRLAAFVGASLPPFILALVLMAVFYVALGWFPPERLGITNSQVVQKAAFIRYTGMMTVDGFLNNRPDISVDAFRHLVLPVVTLSVLHWATLGRVTRAAQIEEMQKEYILAGKAHGLSERAVVWKHAFRNALSPSLTSSALSAASLITGVFVVEVIFNFKGVSDVVVKSTAGVMDAPAVLGFAVFSVIVVLLLMLALDILQAILDPRVREGILDS